MQVQGCIIQGQKAMFLRSCRSKLKRTPCQLRNLISRPSSLHDSEVKPISSRHLSDDGRSPEETAYVRDICFMACHLALPNFHLQEHLREIGAEWIRTAFYISRECHTYAHARWLQGQAACNDASTSHVVLVGG